MSLGDLDWLEVCAMTAAMRVSLLVICGALSGMRSMALAPEPPSPANVVILANANDPDSVELANYYAERRAIPRSNIVALPLNPGETISWTEFIATLWEPLTTRLLTDGWLEGATMSLVDPAGRTKRAFTGHRIGFLVTMRGVPLRIKNDPERFVPNLPITNNKSFRTTAAAVDSELSLLAQGNTPLSGFVTNPLFRQEKPPAAVLAQVVRVSRLDGPSVGDVKRLVDGALRVEREGLIGRAYVDIKGPHAQGDRWLEDVAKLLTTDGWDGDIDRERGTLGAGARADMAALYFGWYQNNLNGPFALPGYEFAPGAIALHIHSFSAGTVRSHSSGWVGPLVARGAAATWGNVWEPYLEFTHQPHMLLQQLMAGKMIGEASYYAVPALSWQAIVVGDPLYRPFAVNFAQQWAERTERSLLVSPYLALREIDKLLATDQAAEALEVAREANRDTPGLAIAYRLAQMLEAGEDNTGAVQALGLARYINTVRASEWGLLADIARLLGRAGAKRESVGIWAKLLSQRNVPESLLIVWLSEARDAAEEAGAFAQAHEWSQARARLLPPPPPPPDKPAEAADPPAESGD